MVGDRERTHRFQVLHFRAECLLRVQKLLQVIQLSALFNAVTVRCWNWETQVLTVFNVLLCASTLERHFWTSWEWNRVSPFIIPSHILMHLITKTIESPIQFYSLQPEFTIKPKSTFGGVLSGWLQWYLYLFEILDPAQQLSLRRGQLLQTATKSADHHLANQNSRAKRIPWCVRLTARTLTISADEEHDENAILKSDPRMGQSRGN
jgi:hypothetical protein